MCRFYCCLAAHQRTRKKDSAEPSFPILWTPPHPPGVIRCGGALLLPRAYRDIVSCIPVQIAHRHFDILFGCFVFGLKSLAFQKITVGLDRSFFIGGGWTVRACGYGMFCHVLSLGLPLTAPLYQFRMVQAHFTNVAG